MENMKDMQVFQSFIDDNIEPIFYGPKPITINQALGQVRDILKKTRLPILIQASNKIQEYMDSDSNFCIDDLNKLQSFIDSWSETNKCHPIIEKFTRKKSAQKFLNKLFLFIYKSMKSDNIDEQQKYSLDRIYDIHGARLVLDFGPNDNYDSMQMLYSFTNDLLFFFMFELGYIAKISEPLLDTSFSPKEHPDVFVPVISGLLEDYQINVKDYYLHPKKNGYQCLHIVFENSRNSRIEIQIRTKSTDRRLEESTCADHFAHDMERYSNSPTLNIDPKRVNIVGFSYTGNGKFEDDACLIESSNIR